MVARGERSEPLEGKANLKPDADSCPRSRIRPLPGVPHRVAMLHPWLPSIAPPGLQIFEPGVVTLEFRFGILRGV